MNWFSKLKQSLSKTSNKIEHLFTRKRLDEESLGELEDYLIMADLGYALVDNFISELRSSYFNKDVTAEDIKNVLSKHILKVLQPVEKQLIIDTEHRPFVIVLCGVNGSGKTTTCAKLGQIWKDQGYSQLWVAADTFRAAAQEQLQTWADRLDIPLVTGQQKTDAAALAYQGIEQAKNEQVDIVIIDTAGRLQNKSHLMDELSKIERVIKKHDPKAPHASILVLDANVGQNALSQVEIFNQAINLSGMIITKLDGTAKGGAIISVAEKHHLPIYAIGIGEKTEDLRQFNATDFTKALLGL